MIPEIIAPVECKSDNTSSTGEKPDPTSAKAGSEPGASISASDSDPVFQVPEDFGFLELLILGCLCLGLGVSNFFWNLVPMYRSQYCVALVCGALAFRG